MPLRVLLAPAKVNLSLAVLGRRPDGLHAIASLMAPVGLCDTVRVRARPGPVACVCPGEPELSGPNNLAARAAEALGEGAAIRIDKRIPVGAGLGGGSADAAAVLRALGGRGRSDLCARLGADVPFALAGVPCWATGTGADLLPLPGLPEAHLAIAWPPDRLSSAAMYAAIDRGPAPDAPPPPPPRADTIEALAAIVRNDFLAEARRRVPAIDALLAALGAAGSLAASLTGKGPACFGLFSRAEAAREAAARVERDLGARGVRAVACALLRGPAA